MWGQVGVHPSVTQEKLGCAKLEDPAPLPTDTCTKHSCEPYEDQTRSSVVSMVGKVSSSFDWFHEQTNQQACKQNLGGVRRETSQNEKNSVASQYIGV